MKRCLAALVALPLFVAVPAHAQTAPAAAPEAAAGDAARLAAARTTVDAIFPLGTYAKLMNGSMQQVMNQMTDGMRQMPLRDLIGVAGLEAEAQGRLGKANIDQIMAIMDPAFAERMRRTMAVMLPEMAKVMSAVEPDMRDGLAQAYAHRFTLDQLNDLNRFFATPSGQAYAANALTIMMDPAMMAKMQAFAPKLMQAMPAIGAAAQKATADLPPAKTWKTLSPAERKKLAELLGVPEAELRARH